MDWKTLPLKGGLQLDLPADLANAHASGMDSEVSIWEGAGLRVLVDEGPFSDPLGSYQRRPDYSLTEKEVAGRPARVVTFTLSDGGRFAGIHFPDVDASAGRGRQITVALQAGPEVDPVVLERIVNSVRFR